MAFAKILETDNSGLLTGSSFLVVEKFIYR
jgi:hypothetical protein